MVIWNPDIGRTFVSVNSESDVEFVSKMIEVASGNIDHFRKLYDDRFKCEPVLVDGTHSDIDHVKKCINLIPIN